MLLAPPGSVLPRVPRRALVLLVLLVSSLAAVPGLAEGPLRVAPPASPEGPRVPGRLRVGVVGTAPFVAHGGGGTYRGFSVEVWRALGLRAGLDWELVPVETVPQALARVADGTLDVAVGPLSITSERLRHVAFTQPYFQASLAILSPPARSGVTEWLRTFVSRPFLTGVTVLLLVLVLVGVLLWLAERRHNAAQFPSAPVEGIGNGVWMALVTMSTVGYGDRVPVTPLGRLVAGVWMVVAMLTASSLTAGIATALTLQGLERTAIQGAEQLRDRRVAVVAGSTGESFALGAGARSLPAASLEDAVALVLAGEAEATVFDRPMLQYYLRQHPDVALRLSEGSYEPQGYGFALPVGSPLQHRLNVALLELQEQLRVEALRKEWLGG